MRELMTTKHLKGDFIKFELPPRLLITSASARDDLSLVDVPVRHPSLIQLIFLTPAMMRRPVDDTPSLVSSP
jgi:hypothetical protein